MPEVSGLEATRIIIQVLSSLSRITHLPPYMQHCREAGVPEPVIISMTAAGNKEECLAAGMRDFMGQSMCLSTTLR